MFSIFCDKSKINITERETLTSGSCGVNHVSVQFSYEWEGLLKTVLFTTENPKEVEHLRPVPALLDTVGECTVPWEVLEEWGHTVYVSVLGTGEHGEQMTTTWATLGEVVRGGVVSDSDVREATKTAYQIMIDTAKEAKQVADSVRRDADAGMFNGEKGDTGDSYNLTAVDREEIAQIVYSIVEQEVVGGEY